MIQPRPGYFECTVGDCAVVELDNGDIIICDTGDGDCVHVAMEGDGYVMGVGGSSVHTDPFVVSCSNTPGGCFTGGGIRG